MVEYLDFGVRIDETSSSELRSLRARKAFSVCQTHKDFGVVELRRYDRDGATFDIIVVDCFNDRVPSRNSVGIKNRERLALVFSGNDVDLPQVRALRKDFPWTPHQNHVPAGEPVSLCLYFEQWAEVERIWTVQQHLQRVLWWLAEASRETLHQADQPLEQVYFDSPVEMILPPDFDDLCHDENRVLVPVQMSRGDGHSVYAVHFVATTEAACTAKRNVSKLVPILISLPNVVHGRVERFPSKLGELATQLSARGVQIDQAIRHKIRQLVPASGISKDVDGRVALILNIPIVRAPDAPVERTEQRGFLIGQDLASVGEAIGALDRHREKFFAVPHLGNVPMGDEARWQGIDITPLTLSTRMTRQYARKASNVVASTADFSGVLAGVGALGSVVAELWSREAWGTWTLVDMDRIKAHNLARHICKDMQVGHSKAHAVKAVIDFNYYSGYAVTTALESSATDWKNEKLLEATAKAELLVDATATLEVSRELSSKHDLPRCAAIFLTPSGSHSVLLFEDAKREIRLDSLEAQYFRAIIDHDWGRSHFARRGNDLLIGTGCRERSAVIPIESVYVYAGILARQVRLGRDQSNAQICVWEQNPETGSIAAIAIPVSSVRQEQRGSWRVIWDEGVQARLHKLRLLNLPNETGGVILGYIDHKLAKIFIVDVLPAPRDSQGSLSGFIRGVEGLRERIEDIQKRTANVVHYIGEWHSHPRWGSLQPSGDDYTLMQYLAEMLRMDGLPAVMVIVGEQDIGVSIKEE